MSASLLRRSIIAVAWLTAASAPSARAEDVSVNLDALGAPQSAPVEGATQTPGSNGQPIEAPANQPKPAASKPKPAAAPKSGAKQTAAEIDFISRTKQNVAPSAANAKPVKAGKPAEPAAPAEVKAQEVEYIPEPIIVRGKATGQPANIAPPPTASPAAPVASPSAPVAVEPIPVATTPSLPAAPKPPATPKKAKPPATVLIDQTALEGGEAAAKPGALQGTPLTKVKPVGSLFVPSDTNNLPSPEAVQGQAQPLPNIGEEPTPLAVPAIVEAPAPAPVPEQPVEQVAVQPEAPAPVPSTPTETP
ncbi:MAG TPA: hypothetical protein DCL54_06295, partial [Alphaproteobacteria bacterium]|nr:hypothetical protein [Alphaproteobacteria bacterium]